MRVTRSSSRCPAVVEAMHRLYEIVPKDAHLDLPLEVNA